KRLLPLHGADQLLYGPNSRVEGDRLVLTGALGDLVFDLTGKDNRLLFDGKATLVADSVKAVFLQLPTLRGYRIRESEFMNVRGPHVLVDGWVWGALPFSRRRYDSVKAENLAPLRPGGAIFYPKCLQLFRGERELLVGDDFGIWLV